MDCDARWSPFNVFLHIGHVRDEVVLRPFSSGRQMPADEDARNSAATKLRKLLGEKLVRPEVNRSSERDPQPREGTAVPELVG